MWFVWSLLGILAGLAVAAVGAFAMRWSVERNRVIAEREDPRDTQLRELLTEIKLRRADSARAQQAVEDANSDAAGVRQALKEAESRAENLQADLDKRIGLMEKESGERLAASEALERLRRDNEALKARVHELEMELSMGHSKDMLDPSIQATGRFQQ